MTRYRVTATLLSLVFAFHVLFSLFNFHFGTGSHEIFPVFDWTLFARTPGKLALDHIHVLSVDEQVLEDGKPITAVVNLASIEEKFFPFPWMKQLGDLHSKKDPEYEKRANDFFSKVFPNNNQVTYRWESVTVQVNDYYFRGKVQKVEKTSEVLRWKR